MNGRKWWVVWAVVFSVNNALDKLLAHLAVLLAQTEELSVNVIFHFHICSWFTFSWMEKLNLGSSVTSLAHKNCTDWHAWKRNTCACDELSCIKVGVGKTQETDVLDTWGCRLLPVSPNRNISLNNLIGKSIVENDSTKCCVVGVVIWDLCHPVIISFLNSTGNVPVCDVAVSIYYWCSPLGLFLSLKL